MKKYLVALTAFTIVAVTATAQIRRNSTDTTSMHSKMDEHYGRGHEMHKFHQHGMMMSQLNLTDAQKQHAKSINDDYRVQLKDLEKNESITLKDYRIKKANLEQKRKSKFQALLTTDQRNKIEQVKKDRSEKMKMVTQKRMEKMKTDLNLTDEQVAKMQAQRESTMGQMKAIRENSSLSDEQK